jgi:hypothetical protein
LHVLFFENDEASLDRFVLVPVQYAKRMAACDERQRAFERRQAEMREQVWHPQCVFIFNVLSWLK